MQHIASSRWRQETWWNFDWCCIEEIPGGIRDLKLLRTHPVDCPVFVVWSNRSGHLPTGRQLNQSSMHKGGHQTAPTCVSKYIFQQGEGQIRCWRPSLPSLHCISVIQQSLATPHSGRNFLFRTSRFTWHCPWNLRVIFRTPNIGGWWILPWLMGYGVVRPIWVWTKLVDWILYGLQQSMGEYRYVLSQLTWSISFFFCNMWHITFPLFQLSPYIFPLVFFFSLLFFSLTFLF